MEPSHILGHLLISLIIIQVHLDITIDGSSLNAVGGQYSRYSVTGTNSSSWLSRILIQFMLKLDHCLTLVQVRTLQCVKMILIRFMPQALPLIHGLPVQEFLITCSSNGTNSSVRISPASGISYIYSYWN